MDKPILTVISPMPLSSSYSETQWRHEVNNVNLNTWLCTRANTFRALCGLQMVVLSVAIRLHRLDLDNPPLNNKSNFVFGERESGEGKWKEKGGMWRKMLRRGEPAGIWSTEHTGTNPENRKLCVYIYPWMRWWRDTRGEMQQRANKEAEKQEKQEPRNSLRVQNYEFPFVSKIYWQLCTLLLGFLGHRCLVVSFSVSRWMNNSNKIKI